MAYKKTDIVIWKYSISESIDPALAAPFNNELGMRMAESSSFCRSLDAFELDINTTVVWRYGTFADFLKSQKDSTEVRQKYLDRVIPIYRNFAIRGI